MIPLTGDHPSRSSTFPPLGVARPTARSFETPVRVLAAALGAIGLIVLTANRPWHQPSVEASSFTDVRKEAAQTRPTTIVKLIEETKDDGAAPITEGIDAVVRNALLPVSALPVEAAHPFHMPALSTKQKAAAERCLTQAIYYEAATEPDSGKAAVAQVILNRVHHPAFPSTVCGVIYQGSTQPGCQFSFTCDGSMRHAPLPLLWSRAGEIARAALAGHVAAGVGMATHYHANYVLPHWAPKLTKIDQVGAHIFYRWPGGWGKPAAFTTRYGGDERIPSLNELYQRPETNDAAAVARTGDMAIAQNRDPTDRRTDNDVGGRIDPAKGWMPKLPDLTLTQSRFHATASQQASEVSTENDSA